MTRRRRAVVTGIGIVSPFGVGVEAAVRGLRETRGCAARVTGVDTLGLKSSLACQVPDAELQTALVSTGCLLPPWSDRATALLSLAMIEALSGTHGLSSMPPGVRMIIGTTLGGMDGGMGFHREVLAGKRGRVWQLLDYLAISQPLSLLIAGVGSQRPWIVSNACASGTSALGLAARCVRYGGEDIVLAAGVDPMSAFTFWGFSSLRLVSADVCRPFDRNRQGLVLGEGAAVLVIEAAEHASARGAPVLAEILGYGETNDAHHATHPDPTGDGARRAMEAALKEAGIEAARVGYVNAHGTGTRANDASEARALSAVLGPAVHDIPVSSTKGHVGHCLGAAGAIEAAFTCLCLRHNFLPATANLEDPDPDFELFLLQGSAFERPVDVALSNSFGFGGMNAAVVLGRGEAMP